ncbi:hypothetical protein [Actinocatenispora rupis]|uniref:Uncharacterized protein n=1 Tax=Actinocatenispora rupis TaxID=519421 RepID=A0A8J3NFE5_9ACTN|nr:hypothetical protein [Actinocatenispora rupis]GID13694.1 hypothetical protein Aru02nite_45830 [Actinocatenispora rupis]
MGRRTGYVVGCLVAVLAVAALGLARSGRSGAEPVGSGAVDMAVTANDPTVEATGPGDGTADLVVSVRNTGDVRQERVTVVVLPPATGRLTGAYRADGIEECVPTMSDGRSGLACQVRDRGPGRAESVHFELTVRVPLAVDAQAGTVALRGLSGPAEHPEDTAVDFLTYAPGATTARRVDFRIRGSRATLARGDGGRYEGSETVTVDNRGATPVDRVVLEVTPPRGVRLGMPFGDLATNCARHGSRDRPSGLRCDIPLGRPGSRGQFTFPLWADAPRVDGTQGVVDLVPLRAHTRLDEPGPHWTRVAFVTAFTVPPTPSATPSRSPSRPPAARRTAAAPDRPVTGAGTALVVGVVALLAGSTAVVVVRRRRARPPTT